MSVTCTTPVTATATASTKMSPYPKRKRAAISYVNTEMEGDSDAEESSYDSDGSCYGTRRQKQRRPTKKAKKVKNTKSGKPPKSKVFPFMELPAEIRNMIYAETLSVPSGHYFQAGFKGRRRVTVRGYPPIYHSRDFNNEEEAIKLRSICMKPLVPALLATCRAVYNEAMPLLYETQFLFEDTTALVPFIANLSDRCRGMVRDITICGWNFGRSHKAMNYPCFTLLASVPNLKRLALDQNVQGYRHFSERMTRTAQQVYRDAHHWLEAVGRAKGRRDAAVEVVELGNFSQPRYWGGSVQSIESEDLAAFQSELRRLLLAR